MTREEALRKVVREYEVKPPHLIVKHDRRTCPGLGKILKDNHQEMIRRDARLGRVFKKPPRAVFMRDQNMKDILTRARLPPKKNSTRHSTQEVRSGLTRRSKGTGRSGCPLCPFITDRPAEVVKQVTIPSSGRVEQVQGRLTCRQDGAGGYIYLLTCSKSGAGYIGQSGRDQPLARFQEHKRSVEKGEQAVGRHFMEQRWGTEELVFKPFIAVKNRSPFVRKYLEKRLISNHGLVESPLGINNNH